MERMLDEGAPDNNDPANSYKDPAAMLEMEDWIDIETGQNPSLEAPVQSPPKTLFNSISTPPAVPFNSTGFVDGFCQVLRF